MARTQLYRPAKWHAWRSGFVQEAPWAEESWSIPVRYVRIPFQEESVNEIVTLMKELSLGPKRSVPCGQTAPGRGSGAGEPDTKRPALTSDKPAVRQKTPAAGRVSAEQRKKEIIRLNKRIDTLKTTIAELTEVQEKRAAGKQAKEAASRTESARPIPAAPSQACTDLRQILVAKRSRPQSQDVRRVEPVETIQKAEQSKDVRNVVVGEQSGCSQAQAKPTKGKLSLEARLQQIVADNKLPKFDVAFQTGVPVAVAGQQPFDARDIINQRVQARQGRDTSEQPNGRKIKTAVRRVQCAPQQPAERKVKKAVCRVLFA